MHAFVAATPALAFQAPMAGLCWANALGSGVKMAAPRVKIANIGAWI